MVGVLASAMIGVTDLLLAVEFVLDQDQGASGTLGLIVECLRSKEKCWTVVLVGIWIPQ